MACCEIDGALSTDLCYSIFSEIILGNQERTLKKLLNTFHYSVLKYYSCSTDGNCVQWFSCSHSGIATCQSFCSRSHHTAKLCRRSWASAQPIQLPGLTVSLEAPGSVGNLAEEKLSEGHTLKRTQNSASI